MKKVRITVLKTMLNEDLAMEYGICRLKAYCGETLLGEGSHLRFIVDRKRFMEKLNT